jgi:hypothetical protein
VHPTRVFFPTRSYDSKRLVVREPLDWVPLFRLFSLMRSFLARSGGQDPHLQDCTFPFDGTGVWASSAMGLVFTLYSEYPNFLARPGLVHRTRYSSIDGFAWTQRDAYRFM